eukprot:317483-Pyramimonas_sp.AAC.1
MGAAPTWNQGLARTEDGPPAPSTLAMAVNVLAITAAATKQDVLAAVDGQKPGISIAARDIE